MAVIAAIVVIAVIAVAAATSFPVGPDRRFLLLLCPSARVWVLDGRPWGWKEGWGRLWRK